MMNMRPLVVVVAAAALLMQTQASAQTAPAPAETGLSRLLSAELARFPGSAGLYVHHLGTGERASVNGDMKFRYASTFKMAIMVLAYRLQDQKKLDLNERKAIPESIWFKCRGTTHTREPKKGVNEQILNVMNNRLADWLGILAGNSSTTIH